MNHRSRHDDLQMLGLVDWAIRPDGVLGAANGSRQQCECSAGQVTTEPEEARPPEKLSPTPEAVNDATPQAAGPSQNSVSDPPEPAQAADLLADDGLSGMDWPTLEAYLAQQDHRGATRPVFGIGAQDADVLIVGEAPGANEDAQGVPFVGRAGKLLDRMLFAIGCSRDTNVYITNICKFRPPDNRDPTPEEVAADWPILERQIDLMAPKLVVAVGRIAAQTLLDSQESLGRLRGHMHGYPQRELSVLVTYHPAYLLRSPQQKARAWDDLCIIARHIGGFSA